LIVDALLTGKPLKSRDISDMISKAAGREIKIQDVASMLSRITDREKCELGHFIKREPEGNGFVYHIVKEALELSEEKIYDLMLKIGKDRYTLAHALEEFPGLRQYIETNVVEPEVETGQKRKGRKPNSEKADVNIKPVETAKKKAMPQPKPVPADLPVPADTKEKADKPEALNLNIRIIIKFEE